jgi:AcrR family transcriptional regulator
MSRKMVRNERRIQILQALHECLKEKPFHQTTIKDIAKKADLNHGMLHYYFENKEDILLQYIDYSYDRYSEIYSEHFNRKLKETTVTLETLSETFRWMLDAVSFDPVESRIFTEIWALAVYSPAVMKKIKAHYRRWRNQMSVLFENLVSDKKTAAKLSLSLIAVAEGMSLFSVFFRKNDLCTDIDFPMMMQSLAPGHAIKKKPCG